MPVRILDGPVWRTEQVAEVAANGARPAGGQVEQDEFPVFPRDIGPCRVAMTEGPRKRQVPPVQFPLRCGQEFLCRLQPLACLGTEQICDLAHRG